MATATDINIGLVTVLDTVLAGGAGVARAATIDTRLAGAGAVLDPVIAGVREGDPHEAQHAKDRQQQELAEAGHGYGLGRGC